MIWNLSQTDLNLSKIKNIVLKICCQLYYTKLICAFHLKSENFIKIIKYNNKKQPFKNLKKSRITENLKTLISRKFKFVLSAFESTLFIPSRLITWMIKMQLPMDKNQIQIIIKQQSNRKLHEIL
jgi:hypothetical protein